MWITENPKANHFFETAYSMVKGFYFCLNLIWNVSSFCVAS